MSRQLGPLDPDRYTSDTCIGSPTGGNMYAITSLNPADAVLQLSVFANDPDNNIGAVSVKMKGGYQMTVGRSGTRNIGVWDFALDEKLTAIKLYTDGVGLTGIDIQTDKQHVEAFALGGQTTKATAIPTGSGAFVGIFGYAGRYVDSLGIAVAK